jgi:O-antigen ligase
MSLRIGLLTILVMALMIYAWRDWFIALCGSIVLMAVIQHPDMPKGVMGIQGLNPWNALYASVVLAWLVSRRREGLVWDLPSYIGIMLFLYVTVIVMGLIRLLADRTGLEYMPISYFLSENLVNYVKWMTVGLLLYDGCRTQKRVVIASGAILAVYFLLAIQVIRWMPISSALSGEELTERSRKIITNEIGYHAVNMSMMLSGASWAMLAATQFFKAFKYKILIVAAAMIIAFGQALTGGRMGYVTWAAVGFVLCVIRWRRYLILLVVVPFAIALIIPGSMERMLQGFGESDAAGQSVTDDYEVTSGRTMIWPYVIEKINESPIIGYGQMAMTRTGLKDYLWSSYGEAFAHPHNAYFEMLLDNGIVGFMLVIPFYITVLWLSMRLFFDRVNPLCAAVGGLSCALILALLIAGVGSQTFYPREGSVGMWAAIGVALRVSVERSRVLATQSRQPRQQYAPTGARPNWA